MQGVSHNILILVCFFLHFFLFALRDLSRFNFKTSYILFDFTFKMYFVYNIYDSFIRKKINLPVYDTSKKRNIKK